MHVHPAYAWTSRSEKKDEGNQIKAFGNMCARSRLQQLQLHFAIKIHIPDISSLPKPPWAKMYCTICSATTSAGLFLRARERRVWWGGEKKRDSQRAKEREKRASRMTCMRETGKAGGPQFAGS